MEGESSVVERCCTELGVEDSGRDTSMRAYKRYVESKFSRVGFEGGNAAFGTDKSSSLLEPVV